jgi:hypothetical protein
MRIKIFITIAMLCSGISTPIKVLSADRAPRGNCCWYLLSSCCDSSNYGAVNTNHQINMVARVNSKEITTLSLLHKKLSSLIEEDPDVLRELYLKCQGLNFLKFYDLTSTAEDNLMIREIIDANGQVKNPDIILNLLLYDQETLDPRDWYFHMQVKDLKIRYPEIINALQSSTETLSSQDLDILFIQYDLIDTADSMKPKEIQAILAECNRPNRGSFRLKALKGYAENSASSVVIKK